MKVDVYGLNLKPILGVGRIQRVLYILFFDTCRQIGSVSKSLISWQNSAKGKLLFQFSQNNIKLLNQLQAKTA